MSNEAHQLRQRNRELTILNHIAQALNQTTEIEEALAVVLADAAEHFGLETGWVWLLRSEDDASYLAAEHNLPPGLADFPQRMQGGCYCLDAYQDGELDRPDNISVIRCSRLRDLTEGTGGLRFHASVPLNVAGKKLGLLNLASAERQALSPEALRLLHTIGDLLGIAVERNRLFQQSRQIGVLEERSRLAREIHDTLAQQFAGVALQLESIEAQLEAGAPIEHVFGHVHKALRLTREGLTAARRSVTDLRGWPLHGRSLPDALRGLASDFELPVDLEFVDEHRPLSPAITVGLYRIAAEALNNIAQHANAEQVTMQLIITPDLITLQIADDGKGFDAEAVSGDRFGLIGISERARLLGGELSVESYPGAGTIVRVNVPLRS